MKGGCHSQRNLPLAAFGRCCQDPCVVGGMGLVLSEIQSTQSMQSMNLVQLMLACSTMLPPFSFLFIQCGVHNPRNRQELACVIAVELELVGTTAVAKISSDRIKLDVRDACRCVPQPAPMLLTGFVFLCHDVRSRWPSQMEILSTNLEKNPKTSPSRCIAAAFKFSNLIP